MWLQKIIETASSHPLYLALGIAVALYLGWALLKRALKILLLAATLVAGYMAWMYFHP